MRINKFNLNSKYCLLITIFACVLLSSTIISAENLPPDEYFFQARPSGSTINYNDLKLNEALNNVLYFLESSMGAGLMLAFGVAAILSSAFGQFRAAIGLLIVAVGAFLIRAYISMFLGTVGIVA